jgi:hypothetical protein
MKKRPNKPNKKSTRSRPKPSWAAIEAMTAAGQSEDAIALHFRLAKNTLRANYADALDAGRDRAREAALGNLIEKVDYCFLDVAERSFLSDWVGPQFGNELYAGINGEGAKDLYDAYCGWKNEGGLFITTGLNIAFDPEKVARFSKIVARWRREFED